MLIPIFEPVGWADPVPGTLLGYNYSFAAVAAIAISAALGLLVRCCSHVLVTDHLLFAAHFGWLAL